MSLSSWLRSLRSYVSQPSASRPRSRGTGKRGNLRLTLESLEDRALPSVNFGGVLAPQSTSPSTGAAVAADAAGDVYYAGTFDGTASFGTTSLTSAGNDDVYVAKVDPNGNYLWAVRLGGAGNDSVAGLAVDKAGNPYLVGYVDGYVLAKLNGGDGSSAWTTRLSFQPGGVVPGAGGNAFVVGRTPTSGSQLFVAAFTPSGAPGWTDQIGNGGPHGSVFFNRQAIAVDPVGADLYVTGGFSGSKVLFHGTGSGPIKTALSSAGGGSVYFLLLTAGGVFETAEAFGPTTNTSFAEGSSIAVDSNYNAYIAGDFSGSVNFNPATTPSYILTSGGTSSSFVVRLNVGAYGLAWARSFGGNNSAARSLATDGLGNVYVTGVFQGAGSFGTSTLTGAGGNDAYAAELDASGSFQWAVNAGGSSDDAGTGIAADSSGDVYVAGSLDMNPVVSNYSAVFGPGPGAGVTTSTTSAFLWKLTQS
jgi:hypothetical protein